MTKEMEKRKQISVLGLKEVELTRFRDWLDVKNERKWKSIRSLRSPAEMNERMALPLIKHGGKRIIVGR